MICLPPAVRRQPRSSWCGSSGAESPARHSPWNSAFLNGRAKLPDVDVFSLDSLRRLPSRIDFMRDTRRFFLLRASSAGRFHRALSHRLE